MQSVADRDLKEAVNEVGRAKVILKKGRERSVERRHPWIFSGAVARTEGTLSPGATVAVCHAEGTTLGYGSWSPTSQISVRMLAFGPDREPDEAFIKELVASAISRRFLSPFTAERGVRLVHGESDGLPGLVVDSYGGWCVTQFASAGAEHWRQTVVEALMAAGAKGVFDRSDVEVRKREGLSMDGTVGLLAGEMPPDLIEIHEGAIRYLVDVRRGHKTGFYLDQRDARRQVAAFAAGREVLNCFSYTGGFGLACAAGGAKSVENIDLSKTALELAARNFDLLFSGGDCPRCPVSFTCADVFKQLRLCRDQGRQFDLIVLDPPKFAETKAQLMRAARGYKDINLLAMKLLRPDGILATFSCSGAMSTDFFDMVCREAAYDARRDFQIVARTGQAADHPVSLAFPEGAYLKGLVLRAVGPVR